MDTKIEPKNRNKVPEKLTKSFKNAGNSTFAIGIFMLVALPAEAFFLHFLGGALNLSSFLVIYLLMAIFMAYFIFAGWGMKKDTFTNAKKSYTRALLLMIISLVSVIVFAPGGILLIFYILLIINNIIAFSQISKYKKIMGS
ncbi:MAG: hypothetical protein M1309_01970 [Actinobacteria bacterium]|nr:hypothetical protein [Actinomycetota bacterium]